MSPSETASESQESEVIANAKRRRVWKIIHIALATLVACVGAAWLIGCCLAVSASPTGAVAWIKLLHGLLFPFPWALIAFTQLLILWKLRPGVTQRWRDFRQSRDTWIYPRIWFGIAAGLCLSPGAIWLLHRWGVWQCPLNAHLYAPTGGYALGCLAGILSPVIVDALRGLYPSRRKSNAPAQADVSQEAESTDHLAPEPPFATFEDLCEWLKDDTPSTQDVLGFTTIARRMARRMMETPAPSQAVVGPLGSGKTTLGRMVKAELEQAQGHRRHRLVQIELWPYRTPEAAVTGILDRLLDEMRRDIPIAEFRGLPQAYAQAIGAAGGFWGSLGRLLQGGDDPQKLLEHIDEAALIIDVRYVLWIEDLERFAGSDGGADESETPEQAIRLAPIRALLHGLDHCRAISVVTATTSLHQRFDLEKIARYMEDLPRIARQRMKAIIEQFHKGCAPLTGETASLFTDLAGSALPTTPDRHGIQLAVDAPMELFLATPRTLKQVLRASYAFWKQFPDELNFNELIALNLLRIEAPKGFDFLLDYEDILRRESDTQRGNIFINDKIPSALNRAFSYEEQEKAETWDARTATRNLIAWLFSSLITRPQSIATKFGDHYLQLFLNEPNRPGHLRDRAFLLRYQAHPDQLETILKDWPEEDRERLKQLVEEIERPSQVSGSGPSAQR